MQLPEDSDFFQVLVVYFLFLNEHDWIYIPGFLFLVILTVIVLALNILDILDCHSRWYCLLCNNNRVRILTISWKFHAISHVRFINALIFIVIIGSYSHSFILGKEITATVIVFEIMQWIIFGSQNWKVETARKFCRSQCDAISLIFVGNSESIINNAAQPHPLATFSNGSSTPNSSERKMFATKENWMKIRWHIQSTSWMQTPPKYSRLLIE